MSPHHPVVTLKRSVKTESMPVTMSRCISQTFWLCFSLYFYFPFCNQHYSQMTDLKIFQSLHLLGRGFLHPLWPFLRLSPFLFLWILFYFVLIWQVFLSYKSFHLNDKIDCLFNNSLPNQPIWVLSDLAPHRFIFQSLPKWLTCQLQKNDSYKLFLICHHCS